MNDSLAEGSFKDRSPSPCMVESDIEKENADNSASEDRKDSLQRSSMNYPVE
jgi:hypothetical protein